MQVSQATCLLSLVTFGALLAPAAALAQKEPRKDRDLITRTELVNEDVSAPDLYQAVRHLRPHFLTVLNRGPTDVMSGGAVLPVVYIDGMKSGDPDVLKGISTKAVEEVRYLTPNKAVMEYGSGHDGGAILVKLIKHP